jgi:hypothetical protein
MIGDLYPIALIMAGDTASHHSWHEIQKLGGRHIFPSHAMPFDLE